MCCREYLKHRAIRGVFSLPASLFLVSAAFAQSPAQQPGQYSAGPINLGERGWTAPESRRPFTEGQLEFEIRSGLASDYIYRGVTLSDRHPAVGAAVGVTYGLLYAAATAASVNLPSKPAAEISFGGGIRPTLGPFNFDLGVLYFSYPGENPAAQSNGINYWEMTARAETAISESFRVGAGFAYSPNVSNTGAWSQYAAAGMAYEVPRQFLPSDLSVSFTAAAGYSWFGNQSADLGGFALPSYLNWQAGVTFTWKAISLDLRYHDTNLSKENCFVFTGDPNAQAGGRPDSITNPDGLASRWCSAAFAAKLWFTLN